MWLPYTVAEQLGRTVQELVHSEISSYVVCLGVAGGNAYNLIDLIGKPGLRVDFVGRCCKPLKLYLCC